MRKNVANKSAFGTRKGSHTLGKGRWRGRMKRRDCGEAVGKALNRKVISSSAHCNRESVSRRVGGIV